MNLDAVLRSLEPEWPETPDMAPAVTARARSAPRRRALRPALAVALASLLVAGTAVAAIPPLREWVGDIFGGRVEVREVPRLPAAEPGPRLGPRLGLAEARRVAGFHAPVPAGFGEFHADPGELTARSGGLLFSAIRGEVVREFVQKMVGPGTTVREATVGAARGIWIEGEPHGFILRRPSGAIEEEPLRLAANTLLWPRGRLVLRIEGAATLAQALRVAATVR